MKCSCEQISLAAFLTGKALGSKGGGGGGIWNQELEMGVTVRGTGRAWRLDVQTCSAGTQGRD